MNLRTRIASITASVALAVGGLVATAPQAEAYSCWQVSSITRACQNGMTNAYFGSKYQFIRVYNGYKVPMTFYVTSTDGSKTTTCIRSGGYQTFDRATAAVSLSVVYFRGGGTPIPCR